MARVLEQIRTYYESRNPWGAEEEEEPLDNSATTSSSGHIEVPPDQEEP